MPRFQVLMQWLEEGYVEVDAATATEAAEKATDCPLPEEHWPSHRSAEVREDVVIPVGEPVAADEAEDLELAGP